MQDFHATGSVQIAAQAVRRLTDGHVWVYASDVESLSGTPEAGDVVAVTAAGGTVLGHGFYSPQSTIRVRLLARGHAAINATLLEARLREAIARRTACTADTNAYRVIHAEADALPGLIVDRYGDRLVMQTLTAGMDRRQDWLAARVQSITGTEAVYARNDSPARALEGLPLTQGFLLGSGPTQVEIREGPARFTVDIAEGQKTGWFCDQRDNRLAVAALSKGKDVLDAFCHTGAFGIQAALVGARSVAGLDSSRAAVTQARAQAALNGVAERCDLRVADAAEALKKIGRSRKRFDVVILDPPAQAKRRAVRDTALDGAVYLNALGLSALRDGGLLVTCSCSHHVTEADLCAVVERAAKTARRKITVLERRGAAPDHPTLDAIPETRYLTCLFVGVR